jgi:hypothetical protein
MFRTIGAVPIPAYLLRVRVSSGIAKRRSIAVDPDFCS